MQYGVTLQFHPPLVLQSSRSFFFNKFINAAMEQILSVNALIHHLHSQVIESRLQNILTNSAGTKFCCPNFTENEGELSCESYNNSIQDSCREGDVDQALQFLAQMEAKGSRPNSISYINLIDGLGKLGRTLEAEAIFHEMVLVISPQFPRTNVCNVMLRCYLRKGLLGLADRVLTLMDDLGLLRDQETYEILLNYCVHSGRLRDTWSIVGVMKMEGFELNSSLYAKILGLYRDNGMWKKAVEIVKEINVMGVPLDKQIYNSMIETYGKFGELCDALEVFDKMQEQGIRPDITTWNSLIRWHCKAGEVAKAAKLFNVMLEQGFYPDPKVIVTIISHLGEHGKWDLLKLSFGIMKRKGYRKSGAIYGVLVDIYGHYGRFQDAEDCVQALKSEGVVLSASIFCALANAYAQQGLCEETVKVLQLMEVEGIEPNLIMLNILLNAFGIVGRHLEAQSIYQHIRESVSCFFSSVIIQQIFAIFGFSSVDFLLLKGMIPDLVTYSSLMKAFMRAKKFDQVLEIYKKMESAGCSPDRKALHMHQTASLILQRKGLSHG